MKNFTNCYIVRVKSLWGFKSIDPPVPFNEFLNKNTKHLKKMLDRNHLMVIDKEGNRIEPMIWKNRVMNFYHKKTQETRLLENITSQYNIQLEKLNYEKQLQENLKLIKKLHAEEESKNKLYKKLKIALQESDELNRNYLERKSNHIAQQLKDIQEQSRKVRSEIAKLDTHLDLLEGETSD